jgi:hypothetical protein
LTTIIIIIIISRIQSYRSGSTFVRHVSECQTIFHRIFNSTTIATECHVNVDLVGIDAVGIIVYSNGDYIARVPSSFATISV